MVVPPKAGASSASSAAAEVPHEAEGLRLHLSAKSATGYKGVIHCPSMKARPYKAMGPGRDGAFLGYFATAVEAAVCYARHLADSAAARHAATTDAHAPQAAAASAAAASAAAARVAPPRRA